MKALFFFGALAAGIATWFILQFLLLRHLGLDSPSHDKPNFFTYLMEGVPRAIAILSGFVVFVIVRWIGRRMTYQSA